MVEVEGGGGDSGGYGGGQDGAFNGYGRAGFCWMVAVLSDGDRRDGQDSQRAVVGRHDLRA